MTRAAFFIVIVTFFSSCGNYRIVKSAAPPGESAKGAVGAADFSTVKALIFDPKCVECHQQYANYSGVKNELNSISAAVESGRMPKNSAPLSENEKLILRTWIQAGAPEAAGQIPTPGAPPETAPLEANWKSINEAIVTPKCVVCHNPKGQAKFLDLSTRQGFFSARNRVFGDGAKLLDFDAPEKSYLILTIEDPEEPMPPTWSNIRRLNQDEVDVLKEWIGAGLP